MDGHAVQHAHLVGMSLGGYLAQMVALGHADRVVSLTLVAAEPLGIAFESNGISDEFMAHFGSMATLDWTDGEAVTAFLLRIAELSAGSSFDAAAAANRIAHELSRTHSMQSAFNNAMLTDIVSARQTAADLRLPALVIHGADDPVISVNAAYGSAQAMPGAELMILDGVGHELPERFLPQISERILALCRRATG